MRSDKTMKKKQQYRKEENHYHALVEIKKGEIVPSDKDSNTDILFSDALKSMTPVKIVVKP